MVDQPQHFEQPPERKAPSSFASKLLKAGAVTGLAFATASVYLGVMACKGKGILAGHINDKIMGVGSITAGAVLAAGSVAAFQHANFAGIVREATRRDDLLLQEASIRKELAGMSR